MGGLLVALPLWQVITHPAQRLTRHIIAVAQMLLSALLIHLTGGRIESHFHIFGSLAILSAYRDPGVLLTASAVTLIDHIVRGLYWPLSVYGVESGASWRWAEHGGWIAFTDCFLILICWQQRQQMWITAEKQAALEALNDNIERTVLARTRQLRESEERSRLVAKHSRVGIFQTDLDGKCSYVNERFCAWRAARPTSCWAPAGPPPWPRKIGRTSPSRGKRPRTCSFPSIANAAWHRTPGR